MFKGHNILYKRIGLHSTTIIVCFYKKNKRLLDINILKSRGSINLN